MSMTRKEFVSILKQIQSEWRELAQEDPTYYHKNIRFDVRKDTAYIQAVYEGKRVEDYKIAVQLADGKKYIIYFFVEQPYISPADDVWRIIDENKLDWSYYVGR